jgi:hypothetical protein
MSFSDCAGLRPLFDAWLDDATSPSESDAIVDHLSTCAACAAYLGEDADLKASVEVEARSPRYAFASRRRVFVARLAAAAAALLLVSGGFYAGRETGASDDAREPSHNGAVARYVEFDPEDVGVFLPPTVANEVLSDAAREGLGERLSRAQSALARAEIELAARRSLEGAELEPKAVVAAFEAYVVARSPKATCHETYRRLRATARLLSKEAPEGDAAVKGWVERAKTQEERAVALKLLSIVGGPNAFDVLARAATSADDLEAAADGLSRLRDERARPILRKLADAPDATPSLRARALGGLHRLGDSTAADALATMLKDTEDPSVRRRIVYALASRPTQKVVDDLPSLAKEAEIDRRDRALLSEMLADLGGDNARALSERLRF